MTFLKSTLMASALILGTATTAIAQDSIADKAKDMAVETGSDMAKDEAKKHMGKKGEHAVKAGEHMMKGDSAKDAMMKVGASEAKSQGTEMAKDMVKGQVMGDTVLTEKGTMDGDDMMTAGKVMAKGGSAEEAAMAVAKDNAKDAMMGKAKSMAKDKMMHQGTIKTAAPTMAAPTVAAPAVADINCPSGTTAQANGTCMVTGDYQPGS